jgi:hypothetical protein
MRPALRVLLMGGGLALVADTADTATVRRLALITGSNYGGSGRPLLRYAVSDAERFARVLVELGGVDAPVSTTTSPAAGTSS